MPKVLIDLHDRCLVAAPIAIVRCGEDGDDLLVVAPSVTIHDELVRPCNQREAIALVKFLGAILAKGVAGAPGTDAPTAAVVRIAPEQVAHRTLMRHFLDAVKLPHIIKVFNVRREPAMLCEDLVLHESGEWKIVKEVREALPCGLAVVLPSALVVEAVDLRDLPAFMVAAEDCNPPRKADLDAKEQGNTLDREVATIYIVPEKEVVRVGWKAADAEKLLEVMELAVDVTTDCHRAPHGVHVALRGKDVLCKVTELLDL
mmetsp:Transcript_87065/g.186627  ORF Transcript_87065/g.186627 Transcript_87065/m.186627 type:complete len:259 (-) Transcript_87065:219-995(-)